MSLKHSFILLGTTDTPADCGHGVGVGNGSGETGEVATVVVHSWHRGTEGPPGGHSCPPSSNAQESDADLQDSAVNLSGGGATRYSRNPRWHLTKISGLGQRE